LTFRTVGLALVVAASTGCAIGPRYTPPKPPVPSRWAESAVVPASAKTLEHWWAAFQDPTLDSLVARAVEGNLDLRMAAARVREARAARGIAAAAGLPQLGFEGAYARTRRSEAVPPFKTASPAASPFGPREQNAFELGFDASWELDVFGGVRRDREAALADVQASQEAQRDVLVTLLAEVARTYTELRGAQRQLGILDDTLRSQKDTLGLVQARFDAGLATALDVSRAEGLLATTTALRPPLERLVKEASHRLGVLLGQEPGALLAELEGARPIPTAPPEVPDGLPSELLARRPDIRRAERELAAATARVGVARADLFPRFSIVGGFGRLSQDAADLDSGRSGFWSFIPRVRWPIVSGGRIRANVRVQGARQEQALLRYEKAVLTALEEVENALVAHAREARRQTALREAVVAERRALDLATHRYMGGLENFLSVLDAQRAVFTAEDQLAQSEKDGTLTLIALYKALGGGWSALEDSSKSRTRPWGSRRNR
jgi:multidrug efflux system outer membrane protein